MVFKFRTWTCQRGETGGGKFVDVSSADVPSSLGGGERRDPTINFSQTDDERRGNETMAIVASVCCLHCEIYRKISKLSRDKN
jgi:hypothetical protein